MNFATCQGQPQHRQCPTCLRWRPNKGLMRPTVKLSRCALFEPMNSPNQKGTRP